MITQDELNKIATMSSLSSDDAKNLLNEVNSIMQCIEPLHQVNSLNVKPLNHPQDMLQRLRLDVESNENQVLNLAKIAPLFEDDLYLVPKVIE